MDENFIYERLKALSGGLERSLYRDISKAFERLSGIMRGLFLS